jgi:hypothetical protein
MAASSKLMMIEAERRFPVRIRIGVPLGGLGGRLDQMRAWLDGNCGADGWALTPSGMRGVLNDALSIYFLDPTLASAFAGALGTKSKPRKACSGCAPMSRPRGSERGCTGRREGSGRCCLRPRAPFLVAMIIVPSKSIAGNAFRSRSWSAWRLSSAGVGGSGPWIRSKSGEQRGRVTRLGG